MPKPANNKPPKRAKPTKAKAKAWLKAHGHLADRVDAMLDTADIPALHGVTAEQWQAARV